MIVVLTIVSKLHCISKDVSFEAKAKPIHCLWASLFVFWLSTQVATMANRGGGHRRKVEDVDFHSLLEDHVRSFGLTKALQFGIYENIDRSQAAFAAGLAYNKELLTQV